MCVPAPHLHQDKGVPGPVRTDPVGCDEVILADIYAARETDTLGVSSLDIVERIERLGTKAHYIPSFDDIETFILENCINGDVLITMGAGNIVEIGENLLNN